MAIFNLIISFLNTIILWTENQKIKKNNKDFKKLNPQDYSVLESNCSLKDIYKNQRCFILGNGPSLLKQDLSLLSNEIVFTANFAYKIKGFSHVSSNYHFLIDDALFRDPTRLVEILVSIKNSDSNPHYFFPIDYKDIVEKTGLEKEYTIHYIRCSAPLKDGLKLQTDITKLITGFNSVVQSAAIVAAYMGFTKIYFIGCDCTGIITNINLLENAKKIDGYAYDFTEKDSEMLKESYKSHITIEDTFDGWTKIFYGYRRLKEHFKNTDVKLINATTGGVLEALPRKMYEDLF